MGSVNWILEETNILQKGEHTFEKVLTEHEFDAIVLDRWKYKKRKPIFSNGVGAPTQIDFL